MNLEHHRLIVIKVGSSSLTEPGGGLAHARLAELVRQLAYLRSQGHRVVLVSSGAVAAGFRRLGLSRRPTSVAEKQASASVGQGLLMEEYNRLFMEYGIPCGQVLLTKGDFSDRVRFRNAHTALEVLLEHGAVPIINENDTVATEELKIGDNDTLSARVAAMIHADLLLLLTDIDGLYTANPAKDKNAKHIPVVEQIDDSILSMAGGAGSSVGTGGMQTKLSGATLATEAGVEVMIASSFGEDAILRALDGSARSTRFIAQASGMRTKQQWLAFYAPNCGNLYVDEGAAKALSEQKKSLLPPGVVAAEGDFVSGDVVTVYERGTHRCLGRGIVSCSRSELYELMKTPGTHKEVIHRDNYIEGA